MAAIYITLIILLIFCIFIWSICKSGNMSKAVELIKHKLIWSCPTQLGNALRTLSSLDIIAEETGVPLFLDATLRPDVKDSISYFMKDYVKDKWTTLTTLDMTEQLNGDKEAVWFTGKFKDYWTTCDVHEEASIDIDKIKECLAGRRKNLWVSTIYAVRPSTLTHAQFRQRRIDWYKKHITPKLYSLARKTLDDLARDKKPVQNQPVIGVHIRYTDNFRDFNKSKLGQTDIKVFKDMLSEIYRYQKYIKFLVCTDNPIVYEELKSLPLYKNVIKPNQLITKVYQPFWEMLLLSRCSEIIGSFSSTFSYEAAYMGDIPLSIYDTRLSKWIVT